MPEPEVVRLARSFKAALLRGEQAQMQEMARKWLGVERRLQGQMDALAYEMAQVKRDGGTVSQEMLINQVRYRELMIQLQDELRGYTDYANRTITDRQRQLLRLGIADAQRTIEAQGVQAGFNRLPTEAVEYLAGMAGDGAPLSRLLIQTWPDAAIGLTQELITGVALGYNPRKTAKNMAQGATGSLDRMMTISRTETLRTYRIASLESYKASGVVEGYLRISAHDSRVCVACLALDGTRYRLDEFMPTHPNCRCTLIPVVDGIGAPKWKAGEEWFVEQDAQTQKDILGKGRYYAWQNGDFALSDLVKVTPNLTWGDSLQVTPLKELGGAKVAPVPVVPSRFPVFKTLPEATQWASDHLASGSVRYEGLQVETANSINAHLAERLPQVAHLRKFQDGKLRSILTQESKGDWHMAMNQDTAILGINRKWARPEQWLEMWDRDTEFQAEKGIPFSSKRYLPREQAIKVTLDHEIGHAVQWSLNDAQKKEWAAAVRDAGRINWKRPTVYAAKDKQEEFAEMFALYVNGRGDLLTDGINTFFANLMRQP